MKLILTCNELKHILTKDGMYPDFALVKIEYCRIIEGGADSLVTIRDERENWEGGFWQGYCKLGLPYGTNLIEPEEEYVFRDVMLTREFTDVYH